MPTVIRQSKPIAIKSHRCNFCGEFILKGERYERSTLKWEELYEWKNHIDCSWIASELDMYDCADDEGLTEEEFRECITEEYAHIMTTHYEDIWESNEFRIPSFAERLKFVIDYHKNKKDGR